MNWFTETAKVLYQNLKMLEQFECCVAIFSWSHHVTVCKYMILFVFRITSRCGFNR